MLCLVCVKNNGEIENCSLQKQEREGKRVHKCYVVQSDALYMSMAGTDLRF